LALAIRSGARVIQIPGMRQASAINRGVQEARGEFVIVLNADDVLYPGAASRLAQALTTDTELAAVYGDAVHVAADGSFISTYPTQAFSSAALNESCIICHPAAAVRRSAFLQIGGLDERLDVVMDYDFWIRLSRAHRMDKIDGVLAASRMHRNNKTLSRRGDGFREVRRTLLAHFGYIPYTWAFAYTMWLMGDADPFFAPARPTRAAVAASLAIGILLNWRHPARYAADWYSHRAV
jgi:glycosyltransferase involved in cell wall biosynthesis